MYSMFNLISPWNISLGANIILTFYYISQNSHISNIQNILYIILGSIVSFITYIIIYLLIFRRHQTLRVTLSIICGLIQFILILWSYSTITQLGYMPTKSIANFMIDYPKYSTILIIERINHVGFIFIICCVSILQYSWLRNHIILNKYFNSTRKKYIFPLCLILFWGFSLLPTQASNLEIHYLKLINTSFTTMLKSNEKKLEDKFVLNRLTLPNLSNSVSGIGKLKPNILFIQMEEVSKDKYGLYTGIKHPTSPFINNFSKNHPEELFVFNNHYSNSGATDTSTTLMYTGLQATRSGKEFGHVPMLWDYANAVGYDTYMVIPFHLTWGKLNEKWAFVPNKLSLDIIVDAKASEKEIIYDNSILDSDVTDIFIDILRYRDNTNPFFGIINLKLPHGDGSGVNKIGYEKLGCSNAARPLSIYECSIFSLDSEMKRIFSELSKLSLLDKTIIVVTPDHGAAQSIRNTRINNYYQEVLSVPLYIYIPLIFQKTMGVKTKMILVNNLNKATQSLDLVPTFLDLLGIHDDLLISDIRKQLDGVSLLREVPNDRWILSMNTNALRKWDPRGFSLTINSKYKYIFFDKSESLFDLESDYKETFSLLTIKTRKYENLYESIRKYIINIKNTREVYAEKYPEYKIKIISDIENHNK